MMNAEAEAFTAHGVELRVDGKVVLSGMTGLKIEIDAQGSVDITTKRYRAEWQRWAAEGGVGPEPSGLICSERL
jgi:hypothetical protein